VGRIARAGWGGSPAGWRIARVGEGSPVGWRIDRVGWGLVGSLAGMRIALVGWGLVDSRMVAGRWHRRTEGSLWPVGGPVGDSR